MVHITTFHHAFKNASSLPLIVSDINNTRYVLKVKGSGDGVLANIVEWIAAHFATELSVPIVSHELLTVEKALLDQVKDPEIRQPLENSLGINFGTVYRKDAVVYADQKIDKKLRDDIFLLDVFLLNIDRTVKNTNMIVEDDKLYCLDFGSSFTLRYCIDDTFFAVDSVLKELKKHPFYDEKIKPDAFIKRIEKIEDQNILSIAHSIPDEWIAEHFDKKYTARIKNAIGKRLLNIKKSAENLKKSLLLLQTMRMQSEEERIQQVLLNKSAFEEKFGKM